MTEIAQNQEYGKFGFQNHFSNFLKEGSNNIVGMFESVFDVDLNEYYESKGIDPEDNKDAGTFEGFRETMGYLHDAACEKYGDDEKKSGYMDKFFGFLDHHLGKMEEFFGEIAKRTCKFFAKMGEHFEKVAKHFGWSDDSSDKTDKTEKDE